MIHKSGAAPLGSARSTRHQPTPPAGIKPGLHSVPQQMKRVDTDRESGNVVHRGSWPKRGTSDPDLRRLALIPAPSSTRGVRTT